MKINTPKASWLRRSLRRAVSASALLLLGFAASGQVLPKSPLGTWDCVMSGAREGLAQITFLGDGTFVSSEILVPKAPRVTSSGNPRGDNIVVRNPGLTNSAPGLPAHMDIFGGEDTGGPWGFDSRGRVIGYFYEISQPITVTNIQQFTLSVTNLDGSVTNLQTFTTNLTATAVTNAISFVGTVVPGKRLTLLASTPAGNVTFRGVPDLPMADLSGSWYGAKHAGPLWYNEFFSLTPIGANTYTVQGGGPTYNYSGRAFSFPQKKMAIALGIYPLFGGDTNQPPPVVRAAVGPLNSRTLGGTLHGLEGNLLSAPHANFTVQRQ